jgi:hypothetical protein
MVRVAVGAVQPDAVAVLAEHPVPEVGIVHGKGQDAVNGGQFVFQVLLVEDIKAFRSAAVPFLLLVAHVFPVEQSSDLSR